MAKKIHCMMCGKEWLHPDALPEQEFYLCFDCSRFWLFNYLRRLKAGIISWWRG
jgi:hypothetical protein